MSFATDVPVSIALNRDVMLTVETQRLLEGLGINPKDAAQYELVGSVLAHRQIVRSFIVLKMRITAILKSGMPFAGLDDVMAITINNICPVQTIRASPEYDEEIYRVREPVLTNNIGLMPNEELVVRRSGDLLTLAHEQFEIQVTEQDLEKITSKSAHKARYAVLSPDATMWRVVSVRSYSIKELIDQVKLSPDSMFCKVDLDTGYYSTSALLNISRRVFDSSAKPTRVLDWLREFYEYGEFPPDANLQHPIVLRWKSMVQAPEFDTNEFSQFAAFHVCRYRGLTSPVRVENQMVVTDNGTMRLRDYFAQFDEIAHAHQS
jgi:hypothetical protein